MATISLTWKDLNIGEDGFNIYRSESPMDVNNMPAPIATVGENVGSYDDGSVVPETLYYYRIGVMRNGEELISEEFGIYAKQTGLGNNILIGGDFLTEGFFGEVEVDDLFDGEELASLIGLTEGTAVNTNEPWLKFIIDGEIIYVAKKSYRSRLSWDDINAVNAVYNDENAPIVERDGYQFRVTLMRGANTDPVTGEGTERHNNSEWDRLMYPIHVDNTSVESWASYSDSDISIKNNEGGATITQETIENNRRVNRGRSSISDFTSFRSGTNSLTSSSTGWRPVLRLIN